MQKTVRCLKHARTLDDPSADHCWKEIIPSDVVELYPSYRRAVGGGPSHPLLTQLGVQSVIVCGESASRCVRASAVDAYSHGFHVTLVEECCFDRSPLSHKVNLFDMHHKYADVLHVDEVIRHLERLRAKA